MADDYRIELGVWIWPGEAVPITYWTQLKEVDVHEDPANTTILIDFSDRSTASLEEAVDLLIEEWNKLIESS